MILLLKKGEQDSPKVPQNLLEFRGIPGNSWEIPCSPCLAGNAFPGNTKLRSILKKKKEETKLLWVVNRVSELESMDVDPHTA